MNPQLKEALDKVCKEKAAAFSTSEKLVNIYIQLQILKAKIQTIATFATSKHIDIPDACTKILDEVANVAIVSGSLAGIEEVDKLMNLYAAVEQAVIPLLQVHYMQGESTKRN